MQSMWDKVLDELRVRVGERNFETWLRPVRVREEKRDAIVLEVPNAFFREWLERHFRSDIEEVLGKISGRKARLRWVVGGATEDENPLRRGPLPSRAETPGSSRKPVLGRLVPGYTFATFVVGESNQAAHGAAVEVARDPGKKYNPLFVWGGVGLGKTHLINALGAEFLERSRNGRLGCLSAEDFVNEMIASIRNDQMNEFRDRYRKLDVLILDDVQFLAGKDRTQEEFFHTFNALQRDGRQVVLTSDKPPSEIAGLEQKLRSRFQGGLIAEIHPPTFEMKVSILIKKAEARGVALPGEVAAYLAEHAGETVRELEGALNNLLATAEFCGASLGLDLARKVVPEKRGEPGAVSLRTILSRVASEFRVTVADLRSHRRNRTLNHARQVAMYLCREWAHLPYARIGEEFGGRDHSTVMHAVRAIERRRGADPATASLLSRLEGGLPKRAEKKSERLRSFRERGGTGVG
ncbi:MAG: chromosomal replication initiator protein DnaA [Candidatus Binatia bacterium]|nr:MAG: chromosomal replication initiator protein DnaA [Candidatus Binatia bacterium]